MKDRVKVMETMTNVVVTAIEDVLVEYEKARRRFGPFHTPHEGYAVILEEMDELWTEVKDNKRLPEDQRRDMRKEAMQVATMALAFMIECC